MDPHAVFKAYDIRGRTDTGELDAELCRLVGSAFVELTGAGAIAVGRDCRASSPPLFEGLVSGITESGADVIDLGQVPTDLVYYYSGANGLPGVMITASHNPPQYNGLKLCRAGAAPVGADTGLTAIKEMVVGGTTHGGGASGAVTTVDAIDSYIEHILGVVSAEAIGPLRVAVDGGNGMVGVVIGRVMARLDCQMDGLYLEPDGTFPNHPADPIQPENLKDLITLVETGGHDLGVAFDGDADRAFFIDDGARPLAGSEVTALIAKWMLERHPGSSIVHNLITSRAVPEMVREMGGTPIRTRVGHSYIKQVMAESGAVFGGEHSGHYYFRDNYRADSGMLAMLVLLQILSEEGRPLSEVRSEASRYSSSGELNYEVADTASSMAKVEEGFAGHPMDRLDGLTVEIGQGWFNIRPSNTEPLLRVNVEAPSPEDIRSIVGRIETLLRTGL